MLDGIVCCYFGNRRSGKSTKCREVALETVMGDGCVCIYVTPNGALTDPFPGEERTRDTLDSEPVPQKIVLRGGSPEDYNAACEFALRAADKWRVVLILDECHRIFGQGFSRGTVSATLFHENRHRGIDLHLVTQWPAFADKILMRAGDYTYWFRLTASEDLEWIKRRWGFHPAQSVARLANWDYILVDADDPPKGWGWVGMGQTDTEEKDE